MGIKRARTVRLGRRALGRVQGSGIELENFKDYSEGDDLRFLDWNAMARLDTLYTKSYRVERETEVSILIDGSASMGLPVKDDKFGLARVVSAALAYVALGENDPVRLISFGGARGQLAYRTTEFCRRRESYASFRPLLTEIRCAGATEMARAVEEFLNQRRPPGVAILVSDFLVPSSVYKAAFSHLLAARYEVKAIQVLGSREAAGSLGAGAYRLRDCETGEVREVTITASVVEACRRRLEDMREELHLHCAGHGITFAAAVGAQNLDDFMVRELPRLGLVR
ncbi:MAG TPA: DUF58 domain-containing protein [Candidatus Binataceae bacterium]|nr:DUF58 domain-containing protein [Candidatus Binataceae bacterium]